MTNELFTVQDALAALYKAGKKVYFNASYLGNCVEIELTGLSASNNPGMYHITGQVVDMDHQFFGDTIDNWISSSEYQRLTLEKIHGKWLLL